MGISYPIISDHIRSYQIISQLHFNMFKLALLLVAFAAVHLAQGEVLWEGRCGQRASSCDNRGNCKLTCDGEVKQDYCAPPKGISIEDVNGNGNYIFECKSSSFPSMQPLVFPPMRPFGQMG